MEEESVLNILMYLFKNHMQENHELDILQNEVSSQLENLGFQPKAIDRAFTWLDRLTEETYGFHLAPHKNTIRIFTDQECSRLSPESRGLLAYLEQENVLSPYERELIINQALALELPLVDESLLKWVALMVLFNQPDNRHSLARMEFLVLDDSTPGIH